MNILSPPATFDAAALQGRLSVECAALDVETNRYIISLGLSADSENWTTAYCSQLLSHNTERRHRLESVLAVWLKLVRVSTRGLEPDAYEVLRASFSSATSLACDIHTLWSEFTDTYDRVLFRMNIEEFLLIESARATLQDAMESVRSNERSLTAKMNEWAPYFGSILTVDGLNIAINSIKERAQTDLTILVDVTGPHFERLRKLASDRKELVKRARTELIVGAGESELAARWLADLASQKEAVKKAITSLQHVRNTIDVLTSSVTGRDGRDVPTTRIFDILTAYNQVRILAKEVHHMGKPLSEALRVLVKRVRRLMRTMRGAL